MNRLLITILSIAALLLVNDKANAQTVTDTIENVTLNNGVCTFEVWCRASQTGIAPSQGLFQINVTLDAFTYLGMSATFSPKYSVLGTIGLARGTMGSRQFFQVDFNTSNPLPSAPEITAAAGGELVFTVSIHVANPNTTAGIAWPYPSGPQNTGGWYYVTQYFVGGDNRPLPIQLASFRAAALPLSDGVQLEWTTVSEINNYGFYVQRSRLKTTGFANVSGLISGHGTTAQRNDYSWTDKHAAGGYYRLNQIDLDGTSQLSEIVEASVPIAYRLEQNYPNPFNPSTTIHYALPERSTVSLTIYNSLGEKVSILVEEAQEPGYHDVKFDGTALASGVYFYRIQAGDYVATKKLILMK